MLLRLMKQTAKPSKRKTAANNCSKTDCLGQSVTYPVIDDEDAETIVYSIFI